MRFEVNDDRHFGGFWGRGVHSKKMLDIFSPDGLIEGDSNRQESS